MDAAGQIDPMVGSDGLLSAPRELDWDVSLCAMAEEKQRLLRLPGAFRACSLSVGSTGSPATNSSFSCFISFPFRSWHGTLVEYLLL